MFGLGLPEILILLIVFAIPLGAVLLCMKISKNSRKKTTSKYIQDKEKEFTVSYCTKCGKEVIEGSSYCHNCGENVSSTKSGSQNSETFQDLSNDDLSAFVGKNSDIYLTKFAKFRTGGIDSFKATWHWPAFFVPFLWMLYRKLYGWAVLAFFVGIIPYIGLLSKIVWGITANYIYYCDAKKNILEIKNICPAPEKQKEVISVKGGVGNAAVWAGALIGVLAICGILAALAIPNFLMFQEKAKNNALSVAASNAAPEIQGWLVSSIKGKNTVSRGERDHDTDGNGVINPDDMTNGELLDKGVCNQYVTMINSKENKKSPWNANLDLWTTDAGIGQVQCLQNVNKQNEIELIVFDKRGGIINSRTLTTE